MRPKRGRLALAIVAIAGVALCVSLWVNEGPLYWLVMTKKEYSTQDSYSDKTGEPHPVQFDVSMTRWTKPGIRHGKVVGYYLENGFKAGQVEFRMGRQTSATCWNFDGTVWFQTGELLEKTYPPSEQHSRPRQKKWSPPWLWGVTDQTEPTAPWWGKQSENP